MPLPYRTMGEAIRALRQRPEVAKTLRTVAAEVGISVPYLSDIERDHRTPSKDLIPKLARALGVLPPEIEAYDTRLHDLKDWFRREPEAVQLIREIMHSGLSLDEVRNALDMAKEPHPL